MTPKIKFEIERFETALTLVRENLGITIIPENYLSEPMDASIVQKTIDSSALERTVYLTIMKKIVIWLPQSKPFWKIFDGTLLIDKN